MQNPGDMHFQPTWASPQHTIDHNDATDIHRRQHGAHRSSTAPAASYGPQSTSPPHPRSLVPGIAPTPAVRHDFSFSNRQVQAPLLPVPPLPPMHRASAGPSYTHTPAPPLVPSGLAQPIAPRPPLPSPLHYLNSNITLPPPVPPKPHLARHTSALPVLEIHQLPHIPRTEQSGKIPAHDEVEDALATALALSQSESDERTAYLKALKEQEEEELARALHESLSMQDIHAYVYSSTTFATSQSRVAGSDSAELNHSEASDDGNDAKSKTLETDFSQPTSVQRSFHVDIPAHVSLEEDEALARRLAAEEDAGAMLQLPLKAGEGVTTSPIAASPLNSPFAGHSPHRVFRALPTPDSIVEHPIPGPDGTSPSIRLQPAPPPLPTYNDFISSPSDPGPASVRPSSSTDVTVHSKIGRHNSNGSARSASDVSSSFSVSDDTPSNRPSSADSANMHGSRPSLPHRSSLSPIAQADEDPTSANSPAVSSVMNANQFVDRELLMGVSIGFTPPNLTSEIVPMQGVMPNVISLPYGRSLPLHLQAPSWRQMLKLLARHSGSRLEPTVDAVALYRGHIKLRTVVQFVKSHQVSVQWRTILWLTLDHVVPPQHLAPKYNGDVNILPYSYTLSSIPTLLRNGSDTSISKIYTVPATNAMPYPALPITFPNFALYLQAALEESRRFMNDSSSGMRKLAKMMDNCYPATKEAQSDLIDDHMDKNSGRVGGLFKRVIGRGNKAKKGRGNDDTYELVTPFVPDGWG